MAIGRYSAIINATRNSLESPVVLTFKMKDGKIAYHMVIGDTAALAESYCAASAAAS